MLASFVNRHVGDYVTAPGGVGRQCVDLTNLYLLEVFKLPHVYADAVNWQFARIAGFKWVRNTPSNNPAPGSLVIWGQYELYHIGSVGHIAIVLLSDVLTVVSLDQNWPEGSPVGMRLHDYSGISGWLAPINSVP